MMSELLDQLKLFIHIGVNNINKKHEPQLFIVKHFNNIKIKHFKIILFPILNNELCYTLTQRRGYYFGFLWVSDLTNLSHPI